MKKSECEGLADLLEKGLTDSLPVLRTLVQAAIKHLRKDYGEESDTHISLKVSPIEESMPVEHPIIDP